MRLYRHHSVEFQNLIEKAKDKFVTDKSRRFNFDNKNKAELFFYADTVEIAEAYKIDDEEYGEVTTLFTYEVSDDIKLLDLRKEENRRKLIKIAEILAEKDNESRLSASESLLHFSYYLNKRDKKRNEKLAEEAISYTTTVEDVIKKENLFEGVNHLNVQTIVDYEIGVILKKELISLGYDGIKFDGGCDKGNEIALLKPAKLVK
ncbi:hypothetical protein CRP6_000001 [Riemerella phage vB_RanS_CRP6]|uniref:hypothetical protein n=1 Tax=Riemerella anatipestifer TaxID=34085 RepID=UPI001C1E799A|nr:hypothetical protein [Riemerella anatipestifer]WCS66407.1 hypothetical protein CRP5_000052 [Riemerella phage vB_RanS_CRP5]WIL01281.1 hypothetical protein CRP6_000001 [Riemerella phage vB_RanS_CRP6]MDY3481054.1 hypothetical protein [Riemerella anatipestifer]MDY3511396.1 hypothetical protein [Riemerella anatipestifer]QWU97347.1 hypothetical protein KPF23_00155 [Riemerella anatipestifer]